MKIFGVALVRSEADIIAVTIRYHLQLGLDGVFVLDNGSSDGTQKILERLAQADDRIRWSRHEGEYQQAELTTGLAQEALRAGADWIVPFDADEFWYAPGRAFREVLDSSKAGALRAQVIHYIQAREQSRRSPESLLTMTRRAARAIGPPDHGRSLVEAQEIGYVEAMYAPKWISRASMNLEIGAGNHSATNLAGRPETTTEVVCLHAPIRSRDTLVLKAAHSRRLEAAGRPPYDGWHTHRVRRLLEEDSIDAEWAANSYKDDALEVYGARRPVIFDSTLRDAVAPFLAHAPAGLSDPEPSETPAERDAWHREMSQNFLTNLHDDALSRTEWAVGLDEQLARARRLVADLEAQMTDRAAWARTLDEELAGARAAIADLETRVAERTGWAQSLEKEVQERRVLIADLESQVADRTAWARTLDEELAGARAVIADCESRVAERTDWAQSLGKELLQTRVIIAQLKAEMAERTAWAQAADRETEKARADVAELQHQLRPLWPSNRTLRAAKSEIAGRSEQIAALDPSAEEIRQWGNAAVEAMASYLDSIRDRRVYPQTSAKQIREKLDRTLPHEGVGFGHLLETFNDVIVPLSRHNGHPRMFGYVQAPGTAIAAIADLLASTLNANLTAWRSAPAAVEIERLTIDWIKQILGVDAGAGGLFVSGGSMANLSALAAARRAKAPPDLTSRGAQSFPQAMRVYVSEETHHSVAKAAALLGIGRDNVRVVGVNERFKIRLDDLVAKITEDLEAGHLPFCVVANAGTVTTGAFDPLAEISGIARRFNLWMHVDASYGGFAALADSARNLFGAMGEADSVALDPHKWLYLPVDCGCVLYRDAEAARATFAHEAEYTRVLEQQPEEAFAFWDYGPELSRRFRALKVWMLLKGVGLRVLGEMIEKNLACARHLERLVQASGDFEMLAPVELSIFCFRYVPERFKAALARGDDPARARLNEQLNALNERLLVALQKDGSSYLSNARLGSRFSLRGCVMNYRTTLRDMEILLADLRRMAQQQE